LNNTEYKKKLENLREELNNDIIKYFNNENKEKYEDLLAKSRELDDIIVEYIRSYGIKA
jgi:hypothetical protein